MLPKNRKNNYSKDIINERINWLEAQTGKDLSTFKDQSSLGHLQQAQGNIENPIGLATVPIGVAGPVRINGDYASGEYWVPMATSEGTLIESYTRGMRLLTMAGGVQTKILDYETHITPVFYVSDIRGALALVDWLESNMGMLQEEVSRHSRHTKLIRSDCEIIGRRVYVKLAYTTGDAMGQNMVTVVTSQLIKLMETRVSFEYYAIRSNMTADKKPSMLNASSVYGRKVHVEAHIPAHLLQRYLGVTPTGMTRYWKDTVIAGNLSGMIGHNGHLANGITAVFIACGQDPAQVVNSSQGHISVEENHDGSFYCALRLPCLQVATVGGGTHLPTQRTCLDMIDCLGPDRANRFAEILAGVLMGGELSISASVVRGDFVSAHQRKNQIARDKAR